MNKKLYHRIVSLLTAFAMTLAVAASMPAISSDQSEVPMCSAEQEDWCEEDTRE